MNSTEKIKQILKDSNNEAFNNGLREGISTAEKIRNWFALNHRLVNPHSLETLLNWSSNAIEELKGKIREKV